MKTLYVLACISLAGCSGSVYTVKNPTFDKDGKIKGVQYFGYKVSDKKTILDRIRNTNTGDISHSMYEVPNSSRYCEPAVKHEKITVPDYDSSYSVYYDAGAFEINKFSVTLDKGMLASVNSESTPGLKSAVEALQGIASLRDGLINGFEAQTDASTANTLDAVAKKTMTAKPIICSASE